MNYISVSVNPTYLCNFRCDFCYLTPEQLADTKKLNLNRFNEMLKEIKSHGYELDHVDLYGGEVGLLSEKYLNDLDNIVYEQGDAEINVITNLSKIHPFFLKDHVNLSVSFDFEAREKHKLVLQNIIKLPKTVSILLLASPKLLELDVDYMIKTLSRIQNVSTVEIKPYSTNQSNQHHVTDREFEEFVKKWLLKYDHRKDFVLINDSNINKCLEGDYNAFSDNHVYITPNGKFGVLEFDQNDNEFFLELDKFEDYLLWAENEKTLVKNNKFCKECDYLGKCLTEHYRDVKSLDNSCNGFKHLLDWAKDHYA